MITRIDELTEPPAVGRFYIVPTVHGSWLGLQRHWPVFLPRHEDAEHLNFPYWHYHIDPRFVDLRAWRIGGDNIFNSSAAQLQALPLHTPHGELAWRRLRCKREMPAYEHGGKPLIKNFRAKFAGQICRPGKAGWICPHKGIALGSVPAVDGVITCPGHGLRICAASGQVLGEQP